MQVCRSLVVLVFREKKSGLRITEPHENMHSRLPFKERGMSSTGSEHYGAIRQVEIPAPPLLRCVTSGSLLKLPGISIPICKMRVIIALFLCSSEMVCLKHVEQGLDIIDTT